MTRTTAGLLIGMLILLTLCAALTGQRWQNHVILAEQKLHLTELQRPPPSLPRTIRTTSVQAPLAGGLVSGTTISDEFQKSPSYQSGVRLQAEINARRRSGDFKSWGGIAPGRFEKLVELMAKQEIEGREQLGGAASASWDHDETQRRTSELQKRQEAQIQALLGPAGYQSWKDWQDTSGVRQWVRDMNERLRPADGLNQEDARRIVTAFRQVELEIRSEPRDPAENGVEYATSAHERIHSVMASQLSPIQLKQFEILQEEKLEVMGTLQQLMEEERSRNGG